MAAVSSDDNDEGTTVAFGCDYAKSSNAKCHGKNCDTEISKGIVRLSRLIPNPFIPQSSTREEQLMPVYYHTDCLINYLRSGNEKKKRILNVEKDFQGFNELRKRDQEKLKKLFQYEEKLQGNLSETSSTADTTYLEHEQEKKYWQISIDKKSTKTKYGLLDESESNAIILYKDFSNQIEAKKYFDTKIKEKLKRGYVVKKQIGRKRKQPTTTSSSPLQTTSPTKRAKRSTTVQTRKQPTRTKAKKSK